MTTQPAPTEDEPPGALVAAVLEDIPALLLETGALEEEDPTRDEDDDSANEDDATSTDDDGGGAEVADDATALELRPRDDVLLEPTLLEPAVLDAALLEPTPLEPPPLEPAAPEDPITAASHVPAAPQVSPTAQSAGVVQRGTHWNAGLQACVGWQSSGP